MNDSDHPTSLTVADDESADDQAQLRQTDAAALTGQVAPFPVRRVDFDEWFADVPKYFATDENVLMSHLTVAMTSVFPDGEDFFVRSVRHFRDRITDPDLRRDVAAFIGQESIHGREHRALNRRLAQHGYPTVEVEGIVKRLLAFRTKTLSPTANLAATAALEHFTATLAEVLLEEPKARADFGHQAVHDLFLWHALEEAEHKAVAFDVYRAIGGSERLRIWTMRFLRYGFVVSMVLLMAGSILRDPEARRLRRLRRDLPAFRAMPMLRRSTWATLKRYEQPDFHPNQTGSFDNLARWRDELFGDAGSLTDYLPSRAA